MAQPKVPIMSTAGAVPVRNEKGELSMEKVKVSRYVTGKRPDYAPDSSDENEEVDEVGGLDEDTSRRRTERLDDREMDDRRMRRLQRRRDESEDEESDEDVETRIQRHRRLVEPELIDGGSEADSDDDVVGRHGDAEDSSGEEEEELDDEEIERRRAMLRQKALAMKRDEEILDVEEEREGSGGEEGEAESSSEYEDYSGSEEEEHLPRLKPVFVRKKDRMTIQERDTSEQKLKELELEKKKHASERRNQTLKMVETELRREAEELRRAAGDDDNGDGVNSGDENDELAYEEWKTRELKRIKRERDEREKMEKEKQEVDKYHSLTEEERRQEQKMNPRVITNKVEKKGRYKFLQKYYHRGVFYLDKDDGVLQRNFCEPTLEDHFDKTVLPKVMQVKNFGRSGRTKYTHLVDQDTTNNESPWGVDSSMNIKFHNTKGGGMKQVFDRPAVKKRK